MRFSTKLWTGSSLLVAAFGAAPAHATLADDVRSGSSIYFREGNITVEGSGYHANDYTLSKGVGTLDVTIDARSIGIDYDLLIDLHGSAVGDTIVWDFDEPLPAGYEVATWTHVTRISGRLVGRLERVADDSDPTCLIGSCPYNVRLRGDGAASYVDFSGTGPFWSTWSRHVSDLDFQLLAGKPRPILASFDVSAPISLCRSYSPRSYSARVGIMTPAVSDGASILVRSTDSSVFPQQRITIPSGRRTTTFSLTIPSGYAGDLVFTASAGGAMDDQLVSVRDCFMLPKFTIEPLLDPDLFPCHACIDAARMSASGGISAHYDGSWYGVDEKNNYVKADELVGAPVVDLIPGHYRELWGFQKPQADLVAFHVSPDDGKVITFPGFELTGPNPRGVALGSSTKGASYLGEKGIVELQLGAGSTIVAADSNYVMAGNYPSQSGPRGFVFDGKLVKDIGTLGTDTWVAGVNEAGDVVGSSLDGNKKSRGFVWRLGKQLEPIGQLSGFSESRAIGIDDNGVVLAHALVKGAVAAIYLWSPEWGAVELKQQLEKNTAFVPTEALAISGGGDVLVRGLLDGEATIVRLVPQ